MLRTVEGTSLFVKNIMKFNIDKGTFITAYVSKPEKVGVEKFACALVSCVLFDKIVKGETTILRIKDAAGSSYEIHSNSILSYRSLVSLSYIFRVNGFQLTDIATASYKEEDSIIAVEDIPGPSGKLRVCIPTEAKEIISDILLISEEIAKEWEYNVVKATLSTSDDNEDETKESKEEYKEKGNLAGFRAKAQGEILFSLLKDVVSATYPIFSTQELEIETPETVNIKKNRKDNLKIYIIETDDIILTVFDNQITGVSNKDKSDNLSYLVGLLQHNYPSYNINIIDNISVVY